MSDHEVNIKILLDLLVRETGDRQQRTSATVLLTEMTDEVSELVLADNRHQALALTLDGVRSAAAYDAFVEVIEHMVATRVVNRDDEDVPTRDALLSSALRPRGLPRPLLAVLLGHAKMHAYDVTLASSAPDSDAGVSLLARYFPDLMRERYADAFTRHPLKREIIATVAINHVINHAGIAFLPVMAQRTGADYGAIVQAYIEADDALDAERRRLDFVSARGDVVEERRQLLAIEQEVAEAVASRLAGQSRQG